MRRLVVCALAALALSSVATGCSSCGDDDPLNPDMGTIPDAPPDGPVVEEELCETLPPVASGTCEVTTGNASTLIKGVILTPSKIYRGGQVLFGATGEISCVGCDCGAGGETVISCPEGVVSPGLINTHDHITFTQNLPYTENPAIRYEHRHQWRRGQDGKPEISSSGGASADQIKWGELRFLMGGATSIVGSGGQKGFLRNLDQAANEEGLNQPAVNFDTFPLDDSSGTRRTGDCNYGQNATTAADIAGDDSYEPHTSEGIDATARNEFLCQSSMTFDTMTPGVSNNLVVGKTAMIHAIGLTAADYAAMAAASTGLIWSPRSNITLYGDTARVTTAARLGVSISLGTDWMPTGSMNMLRELRCADDMNTDYYGKFFSDRDLWQMVTANAAQATKTDDVIGTLAVGKIADISIFKANGKTFRAVIEAEPADVVMVMRAGKVLYGDETAVTALSVGCDTVDVCGTSKKVCAMTEAGKTYAALMASANTYPAFFCSAPQNEPSCTPRRPTAEMGSTIYTGELTANDTDGDGIENGTDKCPTIFDPVRPMDMGVQGDLDADGAGDACDICPLDANTNTCTTANPDDRDNDGEPNSTDNCPDVANPDQADGDTDGKGDACDACPAAANPGTAGCPTTIYLIKNGTVPVGTAVRIENALVTGKGSNGFFAQVKTGDAGDMGPNFSGIFVFTGPMSPNLTTAVVGLRVTVDGKVANFQGQLEIDSVTAVTATTSTPEAAPTPVTATYAEVATGGPRALQLESVLVSVGAATTTAVDTMFGEFTVQAGGATGPTLVVDDFLFPAPSPAVGKSYNGLTGVLALRQMVSKLEPRALSDISEGAPTIASFGPALSYAKVGQTITMPTFPTPLTVTLTGPAQGATNVNIVSMNGALTVMNVIVPNGMTSVTVPVTAVTQNATPVIVTATLASGGPTSMATVRVVGALELPAAVTSLTPADAAVSPAGTVTMTVTLDLPAPVGGTVVAISETPANGTFPAMVTVPANQVSQTFTYTNTGANPMSTLTATLGGSTATAMVTVNTGADHLVINEVEYDQTGTDGTEYIEIYNPSGTAQSLTGLQVVLINGSGGLTYQTIDLTGTLASNAYLVIAGAGVTVPTGVTKIDPGWTTNAIQNGAPDGIALINNTTHVLIDAISYEGSMTSVAISGFTANVSLVEMTATPAADLGTDASSLCRRPNGTDTDNASADWAVCTAGSPGAANP